MKTQVNWCTEYGGCLPAIDHILTCVQNFNDHRSVENAQKSVIPVETILQEEIA